MGFIYIRVSLSLSRPPPLSLLSLLPLENFVSGKFNGKCRNIKFHEEKKSLQVEEEEEGLLGLLFLFFVFRYYIYIYLIIDRVPSKEFFPRPLFLSLSSLENSVSGKFNGNSIAKLQLEKEEEDLFTYLFLSLFRYYIYIYLIIDRVPSREFFSPPLSLLSLE